MHISFKLKTKSSSHFCSQCLRANQLLFCTPTDHWVLKVSCRSVLWILLEAHKRNFIAELCVYVCMYVTMDWEATDQEGEPLPKCSSLPRKDKSFWEKPLWPEQWKRRMTFYIFKLYRKSKADWLIFNQAFAGL